MDHEDGRVQHMAQLVFVSPYLFRDFLTQFIRDGVKDLGMMFSLLCELITAFLFFRVFV